MRICVFLMLSLLAACKSNESSDASFVDQEEIYQQYLVEYNEDRQELFASASYRFGGPNGTTLVVDSSGEIHFDGKAMKRSGHLMGGVFYRYSEETGEAAGKMHLFRLKTAEGDIIENSAFLLPLSIKIPDSINVGKDLHLEWNSSDLKDSELIIVQIEDTATTLKLSFGKQDINNGEILIKSAALGAVNGLIASFSIKRQGDFPLSHPFKKGGFIRCTYIQKSKMVKLHRSNASS